MMKVIKVCVGFIAFMAVLGFAGRTDWSDEVIYTMPEQTYQRIEAKLGTGCSRYDIAKEYMNNKAYYDALH